LELGVEPLNEDLWRLALAAEGAAGLRGAVEARLSVPIIRISGLLRDGRVLVGR
jgi:hypothetical protein